MTVNQSLWDRAIIETIPIWRYVYYLVYNGHFNQIQKQITSVVILHWFKGMTCVINKIILKQSESHLFKRLKKDLRDHFSFESLKLRQLVLLSGGWVK